MRTVTISVDEYKRLLTAAGADDTIVWRETCGAWLDMDEAAPVQDVKGCWKSLIGGDEACFSHRAIE